ncbi:MAG: antirestriction protein ArdA [Candidatus Thiodiazotropha sp. (ex Semelilucina semeliformis)]|nr:antirestriction protein ArdA [Candidatus Thiodiazotropha sp. (ex Semelilucina semeliformis)]
MSEEIRIYVACLAAYNNGYLHGKWIDATQDLDNIWDEVKAMLKSSPVEEEAEEYAIHDFEGYGSYRLSEYEGLDSAHEIACYIVEHGELGAEVLSYFSDMDEAKKMLEDNYQGCHTSLADYAQELTEQTSEVPKHLEFYIDYDKMGRDMEMSGDIFTIETAHDEVHIFWNS